MNLHSHELWQLVGLLLGVGVLVVLALVTRTPYSILLVLGGLGLAFVPGLREHPRKTDEDHGLLRAEEQAVLELRRAGVISDDVMHRILRDLALEELRLDLGA